MDDLTFGGKGSRKISNYMVFETTYFSLACPIGSFITLFLLFLVYLLYILLYHVHGYSCYLTNNSVSFLNVVDIPYTSLYSSPCVLHFKIKGNQLMVILFCKKKKGTQNLRTN